MKIDIKTIIIIILIFIIGILLGFNIKKTESGNTSISSPRENFLPAENGKLSKEYKSKELTSFINKNAAKIQSCYLTYLEKKPTKGEGNLQILIKVEEDGRMSNVRISDNELQDESIANCVIKNFENNYIAPPPIGINHYLTHSLAFKSEENAKKEQEERAKKRDQLPKVLPVK
jgi:hypothetical protein